MLGADVWPQGYCGVIQGKHLGAEARLACLQLWHLCIPLMKHCLPESTGSVVCFGGFYKTYPVMGIAVHCTFPSWVVPQPPAACRQALGSAAAC